MLDPTASPEILFAGLTVLFILTQSAYFLNNLVDDLLLYRLDGNVVTGDREAETLPTMEVLMPVYREPRAVVQESLEGLERIDYPLDRMNVYLIREPDDRAVGSYVDDLVETFREAGLDLETVTVDREIVAEFVETDHWPSTDSSVPRTKASAIKYAFRTLTIPSDHVVTVFDSDTIVPPDTFRLAAAGLETYDVVQAKQTVRNHGEGWLPRFEAMGMAGWCHAIYTKTTRGPYQLLGKAYFFNADQLWEIGDWQTDAITEDLTLGIDAYRNGLSLGVLDRYVQDICPTDFDAWITQKRRWAAGPYPYLRSGSFSIPELLRFWAYSGANQGISLVNVVGVPAGILYFLFVVAGFDLYSSPVLIAITLFNLVNWVYFIAKTYRATIDGVEFSSRREALWFYVVSNPITQLFYSMLWAIPIALAIRDYVRGIHRQRGFEVTPKDVERIRSEDGGD